MYAHDNNKGYIFYKLGHNATSIFASIAFSFVMFSFGKAEDIGCYTTISNTSGENFRQKLANYTNRQSAVACPYTDGAPVTIVSIRCNQPALRALGAVDIKTSKMSDAMKKKFLCSPPLAIVDHRSKVLVPEISYIIYLDNEPFQPTRRSADDQKFDREFRQSLVSTGIPVSYYNTVSNAVCLSFPVSVNYTLQKALDITGFKLSYNMKSFSKLDSCSNIFKEKFGYDLSQPIN